jgi:hypothetical protein
MSSTRRRIGAFDAENAGEKGHGDLLEQGPALFDVEAADLAVNH